MDIGNRDHQETKKLGEFKIRHFCFLVSERQKNICRHCLRPTPLAFFWTKFSYYNMKIMNENYYRGNLLRIIIIRRQIISKCTVGPLKSPCHDLPFSVLHSAREISFSTQLIAYKMTLISLHLINFAVPHCCIKQFSPWQEVLSSLKQSSCLPRSFEV